MNCCEHPNHHECHGHCVSEVANLPEAPSRPSVFAKLSKFFVWWLIISGIYASSSVCPFCGRLGCPVGGASAGLVGGLFAFFLPAGNRLLRSIKQLFSRPKGAAILDRKKPGE